ncbi:HEAT repeat domain-containing protein [Halobium salinum]|uniref:HEAT repeat domain-containing protein n=1 Tax=Halobium salinum TaxID=1364940 RepID=A0ABD5PAL7_9EURY|nr:HEAT repeat domain-containing protein [Halobium salinum]
MTNPDQPPSPDRLTERLEEGARAEAVTLLDRLDAADVDVRACTLRAVRSLVEDRPGVADGLAVPLSEFLTDDDRAVRLTTAKLFVTLARSEAGVVLPVVDSLADRLADDEEFYYVRARCAEALGYVALEHPKAVSDPEILADFRIGLSFDKPEVKEKLAKGLEFVALADPKRLRHQVSRLAEHLDDENELVRYHLTTALVAVGCAFPERGDDASDALVERLSDEDAHVRGRAAEALGVFARGDVDATLLPEAILRELVDDEEAFVRDRARFALDSSRRDAPPDTIPNTIGSIDGVRDTTAEAVEAITAPDGDGNCPHCGAVLPENGPPVCPRCGVPR